MGRAVLARCFGLRGQAVGREGCFDRGKKTTYVALAQVNRTLDAQEHIVQRRTRTHAPVLQQLRAQPDWVDELGGGQPSSKKLS